MRVYAAEHIFPVASPPVRQGALATERGRILAVGGRDEVLARVDPGTDVEELGHVALLPGLINAHCHTELSWLGQDPPQARDYVGWIREVVGRREGEPLAGSRDAAERALAFMESRGTVALGDVGNSTWVVSVLARSSLEGVFFHEVYGPRESDAERLLAEAVRRVNQLVCDADLSRAAGRWRITVTPHAAHTTSASLLRALGRRADHDGSPLSVHVAESVAEVSFLRDGSGPFPELFRARGVWEEGFEAARRSPVEQLHHHGLLTPRTLAVHAIHVSAHDRRRLRDCGTCVVTCPRSNERLGVGLAPVPEFLAAGVPVALGTDSLASTPDLDLFGEMAALCRLYPRLPREAVLRMATLHGARALGLDHRLGSLEPGKLARLVAVPLSTGDDPLRTVCSLPEAVRVL
jgi:cytosine/adenosine deaminase-related metal-dependent hydrolase